MLSVIPLFPNVLSFVSPTGTTIGSPVWVTTSIGTRPFERRKIVPGGAAGLRVSVSANRFAFPSSKWGRGRLGAEPTGNSGRGLRRGRPPPLPGQRNPSGSWQGPVPQAHEAWPGESLGPWPSGRVNGRELP